MKQAPRGLSRGGLLYHIALNFDCQKLCTKSNSSHLDFGELAKSAGPGFKW